MRLSVVMDHSSTALNNAGLVLITLTVFGSSPLTLEISLSFIVISLLVDILLAFGVCTGSGALSALDHAGGP